MKEYFYTITESMLDLGLRGTELNLFAVIYGYSQKGDGLCYASRKELARRCGVNTEKSIYSALKRLEEKGLIKRQSIIRNGVKTDGFSYAFGSVKITDAPVKITDTPPVKITDGSVKFTDNNKDKYKSVNNPPFIPPTPKQVEEYARMRGFVDPVGFADYFVTICSNNGWKMGGGKGKGIENWKNYIVTAWEKRHKEQTFSVAKPGSVREMNSEDFRKFLQ